MPSAFSQAFPPAPKFTEKNVGSLRGKVFLITGAASGVGYELAKLVYGRGGTVYIAARSSKKMNHAARSIEADLPRTRGRLVTLLIDLADLGSIRTAADEFLAREDRLDVLVHNAGVMTPPVGSKSNTRTHGLRIVPPGGIKFGRTGNPKVLKKSMENYMQSKVGNVFLAAEAAKRLGGDGIISVSVNPGLMKTGLQRHGPKVQGIIMSILFKPPLYGAYSELFAALSPAVKAEHNGAFIIPWGRFGNIPAHIEKGLRTRAEGGAGTANKFWNWCERQTRPFM